MENNRLGAIAEMVRKDEKTADIGTDHAQLALYLLGKAMVPAMIISDLHEGPYFRALNIAASSLYRDKIEVRYGDGLKILARGEVFNVVLAGIGGDKIVEILAYDLDKSRSFGQFVIQPMSRPQVVRQFLASQGWPLLEEKIIRENGRLFIIISTCPGDNPYHLSPLEMDVGPLVLKDLKPAGNKEYLFSWLKKYRTAAAGLEQADMSLNILKQQYEEKINKLEEILSDD